MSNKISHNAATAHVKTTRLIAFMSIRSNGIQLAALYKPLGLSPERAAVQKWAKKLALRNAHLASELVQRAISHRNGRLPLARLLAAPLTLTAADLGLQVRAMHTYMHVYMHIVHLPTWASRCASV